MLAGSQLEATDSSDSCLLTDTSLSLQSKMVSSDALTFFLKTKPRKGRKSLLFRAFSKNCSTSQKCNHITVNVQEIK
eukprot:g33816.t1